MARGRHDEVGVAAMSLYWHAVPENEGQDEDDAEDEDDAFT